ncbi:MAG: hypothetical protein A3D65_00895 [Candidatus Lloydbacteria bacterium RIFCSPHIGHO2_02_FULL_50_13]|uniref:Uncharacterized protein n=1 Tax=Candidatus Lloydbacteria bacterium RIFCSPHIGHO2_02_FULL_50_13 TaxID=1798661 RepID=A0A1G2D266_9BACT|nr:MAG: hypothetical protein A3D65_00895 [Candidatus Lloydbacteria bacterium RIFCSPHIGHO2_02_FULL_50_13]
MNVSDFLQRCKPIPIPNDVFHEVVRSEEKCYPLFGKIQAESFRELGHEVGVSGKGVDLMIVRVFA